MKNVDRVDQLNEVTELYGAVNYYRFIAPDAQKAHALADEILNIRPSLNAFGLKCSVLRPPRWPCLKQAGIYKPDARSAPCGRSA